MLQLHVRREEGELQVTLGFRACEKGEVVASPGGLGAEWVRCFWCTMIWSSISIKCLEHPPKEILLSSVVRKSLLLRDKTGYLIKARVEKCM